MERVPNFWEVEISRLTGAGWLLILISIASVLIGVVLSGGVCIVALVAINEALGSESSKYTLAAALALIVATAVGFGKLVWNRGWRYLERRHRPVVREEL